jgi:hypothetical protein
MGEREIAEALSDAHQAAYLCSRPVAPVSRATRRKPVPGTQKTAFGTRNALVAADRQLSDGPLLFFENVPVFIPELRNRNESGLTI